MWSVGICAFYAHWPDSVPYLSPNNPCVEIPSDKDVSMRSLLENLLSRDPRLVEVFFFELFLTFVTVHVIPRMSV